MYLVNDLFTSVENGGKVFFTEKNQCFRFFGCQSWPKKYFRSYGTLSLVMLLNLNHNVKA